MGAPTRVQLLKTHAGNQHFVGFIWFFQVISIFEGDCTGSFTGVDSRLFANESPFPEVKRREMVIGNENDQVS